MDSSVNDRVSEKLSQEHSRRTVIRAGGLGIAAGLTGIVGQDAFAQEASPEATHGHTMGAAATPSGLTDLPPFEPIAGEPLRTVEMLKSVDGVLDVTFTASVSEVTVAGKQVVTRNYNGQFPGPTLVANPGDTIRLHLVNNLDDEFTNIHTHGFHVTPQNNSDNIFIVVDQGTTFDYEYNLPDNHPSGVFWYHPHPHGITERQNSSGMAGTILIQGTNLDTMPELAGLTQQHLFFQINQFAGNGQQIPISEQHNANQMLFLNGQYQPTISIKPGETQRWSLSNASSNSYMLFGLAGHRFHQIAKDGNAFDEVVELDQILLAPAERVEVLIQATNTPGSYPMRQLQAGVGFQVSPDQLAATLVVEGDQMPFTELPDQLIPYKDMRDLPLDQERVILFAPAPAPYYQLIDNRPFEMDYVNQTVKLGTVEKWTIRNLTDEDHPFHIHINDFQVVERNGVPVDAHSLADTQTVPANGELVILQHFEDFTGKFVFHCHILMHEDAGMMHVIEVVE